MIVRHNKSQAPAPFDVPLTSQSVDGVTITPVIAQYLLDNHNAHNRPVKATRVDQYAMELQLGKWKYNGERILFDKKGNLLSGQHRLLAIIKSGISMTVDLKFGIDPDVRDTIDTGAARSTADVLRLVTGDPDSAFQVKALNGIKKILNHRRTGTSAVLAGMMRHDFERGLKVAMAFKGRGGLGRGPVAGAITLAAEAFPQKVKNFVEDIRAGRATTHAGQKLMAYVMGNFNQSRDKEDEVASKVLYAIHAHLTGNSDFEYLKTTKHDEIVDFFLTAINHTLDTLKTIRPTA